LIQDNQELNMYIELSISDFNGILQENQPHNNQFIQALKQLTRVDRKGDSVMMVADPAFPNWGTAGWV
jgi:hypothetical protein